MNKVMLLDKMEMKELGYNAKRENSVCIMIPTDVLDELTSGQFSSILFGKNEWDLVRRGKKKSLLTLTYPVSDQKIMEYLGKGFIESEFNKKERKKILSFSYETPLLLDDYILVVKKKQPKRDIVCPPTVEKRSEMGRGKSPHQAMLNRILTRDVDRITCDDVRLLRKELNLSTADFAEFMGATDRSVRNWEQGYKMSEQTKREIQLALELIFVSKENAGYWAVCEERDALKDELHYLKRHIEKEKEKEEKEATVLKKKGGSPRSYTESQRKEAIVLYLDGKLTNAEIVKKVGLRSIAVLQTIMRNYRNGEGIGVF